MRRSLCTFRKGVLLATGPGVKDCPKKVLNCQSRCPSTAHRGGFLCAPHMFAGFGTTVTHLFPSSTHPACTPCVTHRYHADKPKPISRAVQREGSCLRSPHVEPDASWHWRLPQAPRPSEPSASGIRIRVTSLTRSNLNQINVRTTIWVLTSRSQFSRESFIRSGLEIAGREWSYGALPDTRRGETGIWYHHRSPPNYSLTHPPTHPRNQPLNSRF